MKTDNGAERLLHPSAVAATAPNRIRESLGRTFSRWQHEHWLLAGFIGCSLLSVASIVPGFAAVQADRVEARLELTEFDLALPAPLHTSTAPISEVPQWRSVAIQPGQTLGDVFTELGLSGQTLHRLLDHPGAREPLTRIRPGDLFDFEIAGDGSLKAIRFSKGESERVVLAFEDDRIVQSNQSQPLQNRVLATSGVITDSLFATAERAGMSNASILELAKVFGYDIDFAQDLREGDEFHVMYEEIWRDGERLRSGDILAATFINQGKKYQVFRYAFADGRVDYFDADGRPVKKGFLRMPIEFARISSRFSSARRHPILGTTRAHRGVDYAAGSGTPIMAAGEGRVLFSGWKSGYGRAVILQHAGNVTTLYGHMSRFGRYKTGARVRQGDVIGYVGATGLATAPHLHYEFRVGGMHRDPLTVTMPKPQPLPGSELARFSLQRQPLASQLALRESGSQFASR